MISLIASSTALASAAEPCLLLYPAAPTVFRYSTDRYEIVYDQDERYDPGFGVLGEMLWDVRADRVPFEVYQAPFIESFEPSSSGLSEFYTTGSLVTVVVDGFGRAPRQLSDVYVQFEARPPNSTVDILVNGERITGLRYRIPRMVIDTPTPDGFYSDTVTLEIDWTGAQFIHVIAYSDRNGNRVFDGEPCFRIVMEDLTVPAEPSTWGTLKTLYKGD